ncbi:terminase large subunit domain-containing protein [Bradyrhizobium sp. USDA 4354]
MAARDARLVQRPIEFKLDDSFLEAISGEGAPAHGRTPAFVLVDELHIWKNAELWKALASALPKTQGSLMVVATTAGAWPREHRACSEPTVRCGGSCVS